MKKKLLKFSLALGLLFQPLITVQANDEVENTNGNEQVSEIVPSISEADEVIQLVNKLNEALSADQTKLLQSLLENSETSDMLAEVLLVHESGKFEEAYLQYDDLQNIESITTEQLGLIDLFKELAESNLLLSEYTIPVIEQPSFDTETENVEESQAATKRSGEEDPSTPDAIQSASEVIEETEEVPVEENTEESVSEVELEVVSSETVNYRGYLINSSGSILETPGGELNRQVDDLAGSEVRVTEEAAASNGTTWLSIQVIGADARGWILSNEVSEEEISEVQDVSYRGYLNRRMDTINTRPWGTRGYQEIRRVNDLNGREVEITQEAKTQRATWLYVKVRGTNVTGWIDKAGVDIESISISNSVEYRGYLSRRNDTLNTKPWGTPGFEEIRHVDNLVGREVEVLEKATTQRATWLYVHVRGTDITAWIDEAGVEPESITSQSSIEYRGILSRPNDTLNTQPWGTPGFKEIRHVEDLVGSEVEVLQEAKTQRATWLYVHVRGSDIRGWVDRVGVEPESITSQKNVNYRGYLSRRNDTINTLPWGVRGFKEIRRVNNLNGREVRVTKEAVTQRATWLYVDIIGTNISGWVDKSGITPEQISSQKNVNYESYLFRSNDSINTQPWGTIGNQVLRNVGNLVSTEVRVTREATTQRATWAFITIPGTSISGWVDKAGLRDNILIYLDPGHGGIPSRGGNPGAVYNGVREQDLNLTISLQVRDELEKLGYEVVMSREDGNNSYEDHWEDDLYARPAHANEIGADILVSVHHNASGTWDSSMNGIETYIYGVNSAHPPLPENEPYHDDPTRMSESRKLANAIHKDLIDNTGAYDRGVRNGAFVVVREAQMPAVLLELGFMSNRAELNKLTTTSYQQKLVNGIVTGIHDYFLF